MIHIAPCSCELHVRIRELEAERDEAFERNGELIALEAAFERKAAEQVLRAENAEALFEETAKALGRQTTALVAAEARVAELEHAATTMCKMCGKRGIGWWDGNVPGPRCWDHAPTRTEVETRSWHPWKTVGDETPSQGVQEREAD